MLQAMGIEPRKSEALLLPSCPDNPEKKCLLSLSKMLMFILCTTTMQPAKPGQSYAVSDLTLTFVNL